MQKRGVEVDEEIHDYLLETISANVNQQSTSQFSNVFWESQCKAASLKELFSNLSFPYAQFSCTSICGDQMYDIFWEAVGSLELMGFKVMALTYDGLSVNRRLFRLHNPTATPDDIVYKTLNPYADDGRYVYFFADPPHLMKTVRNGWASK